jgi:pimeloyl-ACP methyl ester carboxylesterase
MPTAAVNGIELWYETLGEPEDPALLLIAGLGDQATGWPEELCWAFVSRGFHVVRFDNRDAGLSTGFDGHPVDVEATAARFLAGEPLDAPYLLADMAADCVGLLDELGIGAAHVLGSSLGGMVAQTLAIAHPERVASLTSLMATTGERELLLPDAEVLGVLLEPGGTDRASAVERAVRWAQTFGSPDHLDLDSVRETAGRAFDRANRPDGVVRQLLAIAASPSRADALATLSVPTVVIHGSLDRLVRPEGGRRTAELVPEATLVEIEGMGHDLPQAFWATVVEHVTGLAARAHTA